MSITKETCSGTLVAEISPYPTVVSVVIAK